MRRFRYEYGAGPLHLLSALAALAIAGFAVLKIFEGQNTSQFLSFGLFFVGAILIHDVVLFPLYAGVDRLLLRRSGVHRALPADARRTKLSHGPDGWFEERGDTATGPRPVSAINHIRVPTLLSALFLIVWFPLILGLVEDEYSVVSGQSTDGYLERWLALTAVLFLVSGLLYAVRLGRSRARARG